MYLFNDFDFYRTGGRSFLRKQTVTDKDYVC